MKCFVSFLSRLMLLADGSMHELDHSKGRGQASVPSAPHIAARGRTVKIGIGFFVTTIAFAALIAALFGSSSTNARSRETPWGKYLFAGLIAVAIYLMMQLVREVVLHATGLAPVAAMTGADQWASRIKMSAPWFVLPFLIAATICWLARQRPWQPPRVLGESVTITLQRLLDGVVLGLIMLPGFSIAIELLVMTGQPLPPVLQSRFDPLVMAILGIPGFFVGAIVVRDVRSAAHDEAKHVARQNAANRQRIKQLLADKFFASAE